MRLANQERSIVNDAIDECLEACDGDITRTANYLVDELHDMEGSGTPWVAELVQACTLVGVKQLIRQRTRSKRIAVSSTSMPAYYTVGLSTAYYTVGLSTAQWMHVDVEDLDPVIERLAKSARSYTEHAAVLIDAQVHAKSHGVTTAAEGFAAEGITITELAS